MLSIEGDTTDLLSLMRLIEAEAKAGKKLFLLDQASWIDVPHTRGEYEHGAACSRALKKLARRLGIVLVVCVQINRAGAADAAKGERIELHHIRASGTWENDCDGAIIIQQRTMPEGRNGPATLEFSVAKNRQGWCGDDFKLSWHMAQGRIENWVPA